MFRPGELSCQRRNVNFPVDKKRESLWHFVQVWTLYRRVKIKSLHDGGNVVRKRNSCLWEGTLILCLCLYWLSLSHTQTQSSNYDFSSLRDNNRKLCRMMCGKTEYHAIVRGAGMMTNMGRGLRWTTLSALPPHFCFWEDFVFWQFLRSEVILGVHRNSWWA